MVQLDNAVLKLEKILVTINEAGDALDLDSLHRQLNELQAEMGAPGFWDNVAHASKVNKQVSLLEGKIAQHKALVEQHEEITLMVELANEEEDESLVDEINAEVDALEQRAEALQINTLLSGEYDNSNAILSLHAGAGGTEAQDWTQMLYRMYTRWAERHNFTVKVMDFLEGDEAGIKSVTFQINGENAYGYLKSEKGVHRLVRISPFDSSARRHTSFASLEVLPELDDDIEVEINPAALRIDTYRSSGAGGQHINKTDSAVRITHIPTGFVTSCQTERSQIQNRETAMRMLKSKLIEMKEREAMEKLSDIKGELKKIEWGSQIRSYVFQPNTMVKDHRTLAETGNVNAVMDGELDMFIYEYLKKM